VMASLLGIGTGLSIAATVTLAAVIQWQSYDKLCFKTSDGSRDCQPALVMPLGVGGGLTVLFGVPFGLLLYKLHQEEK